MGGVAWTAEEDRLLRKCIETYGEGKWHRVPLLSGLNRCRKSCRLRWLNYLRPTIKRGRFTEEEVDIIINLHHLFGNRWALIASRLPGRTANDVKNYWNCRLSRVLKNNDDNNNANHQGTEENLYEKTITRSEVEEIRQPQKHATSSTSLSHLQQLQPSNMEEKSGGCSNSDPLIPTLYTKDGEVDQKEKGWNYSAIEEDDLFWDLTPMDFDQFDALNVRFDEWDDLIMNLDFS